MESTEYNPEKKYVSIVGITLIIISLIGYILFVVLSRCTDMFTTAGAIVYLVACFLVFIGGLVCIGVAKKKKYGSKKIVSIAEILAVIAVALFAIGSWTTIWA